MSCANENMDETNVDAIKVEDTDNDDAFSLCKDTDDPLAADESDLASTLNKSDFTSSQATKCITLASTVSGINHSVPVVHINALPRTTGNTVHYYTRSSLPPTGQKTVHQVPESTVSMQSIPGATSQMIRGSNAKARTGGVRTRGCRETRVDGARIEGVATGGAENEEGVDWAGVGEARGKGARGRGARAKRARVRGAGARGRTRSHVGGSDRRSGGCGRGLGRNRLSTSSDLMLGMLSDLPTGELLEKPQCPKKRKLWSGFEDCLPVSAVQVESEVAAPEAPSTFDSSPPEVGGGAYGEDNEEVNSTSSVFGGSPGIRPSVSRPLRERESENFLNYGSEEEALGDDDDAALPAYPVRLRVLLDMPAVEETVEEAVEEVVVHEVFLPCLDKPESSSLNRDEDSGSVQYQPTEMYDFSWRAFPNPHIPSNLRREKFVDSNPGPKEHYPDPYAAFVAIWDMDIMTQICAQTNLYAQQHAEQLLATGRLGPLSRINDWKDIDVDELYIYFSIVLAMGVVVRSRLAEYWTTKSDIFSTPGFASTMNLRRFQLISRLLHFSDNQSLDTSMDRSQAKLFKIDPIIRHLNRKFSALYSLGQNIALDESLTQWKGFSGINQLIPHKTAEVGIKTYEVCESRTGYLWRFEVHSGFETQQASDPVSGRIPSIVLRLLQGLEHKGHTVWMDNYYNSPALARRLKSLNFDCVGTLRTNRKFVPVELATLQNYGLAEGQIAGCTSGDVDLLVWRDKNKVALISTYHGAATTTYGETLKPTLVHEYNVCMGGVDKKDQMLAQYPIERKRTRIWYKKFFRRLLNVSVLNAFIMYRHNNQLVAHRNFRLELSRLLIARHQKRPPVANVPFRVLPKLSAEMLRHIPAELWMCGDGQRKLRRICVVCKKQTHTYCPGCNVTLCIFRRHSNLVISPSGSSNAVSCFFSYHSK